MRLASVAILALSVFSVQESRLVSAQAPYPSKPVQMVTTFPAGMATDIVARIYADKLSARLGQPVLVNNIAGAAGTIATKAVASAASDGYTILMVNSSHAINPFLYQSLPYDSLRDFAGVALVGESPMVLQVHPDLGVRTVNEFIALAKRKPGTINYASAGTGSSTHLAAAAFAQAASIDLAHVPYKSMANLVSDLLAGRVQAVVSPFGPTLAYARQGKLVPLAVSTAEPMHEPVELPSARQAAGIDYVFAVWYGIVAPAKVPTAILEHLSRAAQQVGEDDEVKAKFKALGVSPRFVGLREFDAYIKADMQRIGPVVRNSGAKAE